MAVIKLLHTRSIAPLIGLSMAAFALDQAHPSSGREAQGVSYWLPVPLVVPVTHGERPYSTQAIWRVFTAGDTVSESFRERFDGRACEDTPYFLRREHLDFCRALLLTRWLQVPAGASDSAIAVFALTFADSSLDLSDGADSIGTISAVIVAIAGRRGPARQVRLDYDARHSSRPIKVRNAVLVGLPDDSTALADRQLAQAIPFVLGLPPGALLQDTSGALHLDPRARHRLNRDKVEVVVTPTTLTLDTKIHGCGSMNCVVAYPVYTVAVASRSPRVLIYLEVIHGEGVLIEQILDLAGSDDAGAPPGRMARVLFTPDNRRRRIKVIGDWHDAPAPEIRIEWQGEIATVRLPAIN